MFKTLQRIYARTEDVDMMRKAVAKGWITRAEFLTITGVSYD